MKTQWITAALLGAALVAGCNTQSSEGVEEPAATDEVVAPDTESQDANAPGSTSTSQDTGARADASRPAPAPASQRAPSVTSGSTPTPAPVEPRSVEVPAGTALPLTLQTALSSETATVEMPVSATLKQAISVDGVTVLPAGTRLTGTVTEVQQSGRVKGRARVSFVLDRATIDGTSYALATDPVTFEAEGTKGEDAAKIGVGAGVGAAIGGILGGGSGAAKGAAIGGAAGTGAVLATKGAQVTVAEGADVAATLAKPFARRVR